MGRNDSGAKVSLAIEEQYEVARQFVKRYGLSHDDADDIIQEAIIRIWESGRGVNAAYVKQAVRYEVQDYWRQAKSSPSSLNLDMARQTSDEGTLLLSDMIRDEGWSVEEQVLLTLDIEAANRIVGNRGPGGIQRAGLVTRLIESQGEPAGRNLRSRYGEKLRRIRAGMPLVEEEVQTDDYAAAA